MDILTMYVPDSLYSHLCRSFHSYFHLVQPVQDLQEVVGSSVGFKTSQAAVGWISKRLWHCGVIV